MLLEVDWRSLLHESEALRSPLQLGVALAAAATLTCLPRTAAAFRQYGVWTAITCVLALESTLGATYRKAALRAVGTGFGGLCGLVCVTATAAVARRKGHHVTQPEAATMICLVTAFGCAIQWLRLRDSPNNRDYFYVVTLVTLCLVSLSGFGDSLTVAGAVTAAAWRCCTVAVGGALSFVVSAVFFPLYATRLLRATLSDAILGSSALLVSALDAYLPPPPPRPSLDSPRSFSAPRISTSSPPASSGGAAKPPRPRPAPPALRELEAATLRALDRLGTLAAQSREERRLRLAPSAGGGRGRGHGRHRSESGAGGKGGERGSGWRGGLKWVEERGAKAVATAAKAQQQQLCTAQLKAAESGCRALFTGAIAALHAQEEATGRYKAAQRHAEADDGAVNHEATDGGGCEQNLPGPLAGCTAHEATLRAARDAIAVVCVAAAARARGEEEEEEEEQGEAGENDDSACNGGEERGGGGGASAPPDGGRVLRAAVARLDAAWHALVDDVDGDGSWLAAVSADARHCAQQHRTADAAASSAARTRAEVAALSAACSCVCEAAHAAKRIAAALLPAPPAPQPPPRHAPLRYTPHQRAHNGAGEDGHGASSPSFFNTFFSSPEKGQGAAAGGFAPTASADRLRARFDAAVSAAHVRRMTFRDA